MPLPMTALLLSFCLFADEAPTVPLELQVELLGKVLRYDWSFTARAGQEATLLIVHQGTASSLGPARQLMASLNHQKALGGISHQEGLVEFTSAAELAELVRRRGATVVIIAPGFSADAPEIAAALSGRDVLTVSTTAAGVREGLVLGFDLVAGKPRMVINLAQARRQQADFRAEVLKLMTVYQ